MTKTSSLATAATKIHHLLGDFSQFTPYSFSPLKCVGGLRNRHIENILSEKNKTEKQT